MKKLVLVSVILLLWAVPGFAGTWCQWDGSKGINCRTTSRSYITISGVRVTVSAENLNPRGWYERTITEPTVGADQVKDAEVWGFANDEISLTWTVRDLTTTEIDTRDAQLMDITDYYLWKALIVTGTITQQQAADNLPQEMIDAYLARKRLLGD
jgi:hypothetical protein